MKWTIGSNLFCDIFCPGRYSINVKQVLSRWDKCSKWCFSLVLCLQSFFKIYTCTQHGNSSAFLDRNFTACSSTPNRSDTGSTKLLFLACLNVWHHDIKCLFTLRFFFLPILHLLFIVLDESQQDRLLK